MLDQLPKGAHYQYMMGDIAREHFIDEGAFYLDLWPMSGLFLVVISPGIGVQVTQSNAPLSLRRPLLLHRFFKPITGGLTLFDMPEEDWKPWRAVFNKGFSVEHVLSLVPGMVQETVIYADTLRSLAHKDEMVFLDIKTLRFTIDMIGRTIL